MPIHWGYSGEVVGAIVNDLSPLSLDPNADIHGAKSFVCQLRRGRLDHGSPPRPLPMAPVPLLDAPTPDTPAAAQPAGRFRHGK
jgi:hypothetical protein